MAAEQSQAVNGNDDNFIPQQERPNEQLLFAALTGDWDAAERILQPENELVRAHITSTGETILQILAGAAGKEKHVVFVEKLLRKMHPHDLLITNNYGSTALHYAASAGNRVVASLLVEKNPTLPTIPNNGGLTPVYMAALSGHREMTEDLLRDIVLRPQDATYGCTILNMCITAGLYGTALQMVQNYSHLAASKDENQEGPMLMLARKPVAFADKGEGQIRSWHKIIYTSFWKKVTRDHEKRLQTEVFQLLNKIWDVVKRERHLREDTIGLLFVAAKTGNYEFLVDLLRRYPNLLYEVDSSNHSIFHIAVLHRYESIFSLIYEIGAFKELIATYRQNDDDTTMLHLAGRLAPSCQLNVLPGAALQMQRELLWYKEVEKIVPPSYRNMKDRNEKTPHDIFVEEHKDLMKEGEKWMKETAHACLIVATLIATVVFTSAFTIPGGNNDSGVPILLGNKFFVVFVASEITAMFSAATSIIMFLCILTSRYAEEDFIESLPFLLLTGITALFVSLAAMMTAFCTTFFLFNHHGLTSVPTLLGLFILVPLMLLWFKYPLLVDILTSTYGSSFLFGSRGRLFGT